MAVLLAWDERFAPYLLVGSILLRPPTTCRVTKHWRPSSRTAPTRRYYGGRYLSGWTAWNHIRAVASLAAAATLIIALLVG
jgi:hypothetical protein